MSAGPESTPPDGGDDASVAPAPQAGGPFAEIELDGVRVTLLGTAHVSRASADEVRARIGSGDFDAVAIELDRSRHAALTDPDRMLRTDLFTVFRRGQGGAMAANLALGAFQQRLADQYGIEPGQEMRDAIAAANDADLPLALIDRDI
ncbi:MAG: conjugal transfer protein TraB, partial [Deinococcus-Thermus bacterium]|nr:conjugal transfer protein TraB [Deinococcota bacterium]